MARDSRLQLRHAALFALTVVASSSFWLLRASTEKDSQGVIGRLRYWYSSLQGGAGPTLVELVESPSTAALPEVVESTSSALRSSQEHDDRGAKGGGDAAPQQAEVARLWEPVLPAKGTYSALVRVMQSLLRPSANRVPWDQVQDPRVFLIEPVSDSFDRSVKVDTLILKHMGPQDRIIHVVEVRYLQKAGRVFPDIVAFPPTAVGEAKIKRLCAEERNNPDQDRCLQYRTAQMKFSWGLVQVMKRLAGRRASSSAAEEAQRPRMPQWVMVKDDDTFVHVPNLLREVAALNRTSTDLVSIAHTNGNGIFGGAGWILSGKLAECYAGQPGQQYLDLQRGAIETGTVFYDQLIVKVVNLVPGAKLLHSIAMHPFAPNDPDLCKYKVNKKPLACFQTVECGCARVSRPTSWHFCGYPARHWDETAELLAAIPWSK